VIIAFVDAHFLAHISSNFGGGERELKLRTGALPTPITLQNNRRLYHRSYWVTCSVYGSLPVPLLVEPIQTKEQLHSKVQNCSQLPGVWPAQFCLAHIPLESLKPLKPRKRLRISRASTGPARQLTGGRPCLKNQRLDQKCIFRGS
jgi:hypothetical protein